MKRHAEGAWERAMKVQEVILRALAEKITWCQAAEISAYRTGVCGGVGRVYSAISQSLPCSEWHSSALLERSQNRIGHRPG